MKLGYFNNARSEVRWLFCIALLVGISSCATVDKYDSIRDDQSKERFGYIFDVDSNRIPNSYDADTIRLLMPSIIDDFPYAKYNESILSTLSEEQCSREGVRNAKKTKSVYSASLFAAAYLSICDENSLNRYEEEVDEIVSLYSMVAENGSYISPVNFNHPEDFYTFLFLKNYTLVDVNVVNDLNQVVFGVYYLPPNSRSVKTLYIRPMSQVGYMEEADGSVSEHVDSLIAPGSPWNELAYLALISRTVKMLQAYENLDELDELIAAYEETVIKFKILSAQHDAFIHREKNVDINFQEVVAAADSGDPEAIVFLAIYDKDFMPIFTAENRVVLINELMDTLVRFSIFRASLLLFGEKICEADILKSAFSALRNYDSDAQVIKENYAVLLERAQGCVSSESKLIRANEMLRTGSGAAASGENYAVGLLEDSHREGNVEATVELAKILYSGSNGISVDKARAMTLLRSANSGASHSQLGYFYQYGGKGEQDIDLAEMHHQKAVSLDSGSYSHCHLGDIYSTNSQKLDIDRAIEHYELGALSGHTYCIWAIGSTYYENVRDFKKAHYWNDLSARRGYAKAVNSVGFMYANGRYVSQDFSKAKQFYLKAAASGDSIAYRNIGDIYEYGRGVEVDLKKAALFYRQSAIRNDRVGKTLLCELLRKRKVSAGIDSTGICSDSGNALTVDKKVKMAAPK